jgi:hypothetical protein
VTKVEGDILRRRFSRGDFPTGAISPGAIFRVNFPGGDFPRGDFLDPLKTNENEQKFFPSSFRDDVIKNTQT